MKGRPYRDHSYGNDSVEGARFIDRLLTVRGSLRRQGRRLLGFVADCIAAVRNPAVRPSLLPAATSGPERFPFKELGYSPASLPVSS
jgi:hypothetical protein